MQFCKGFMISFYLKNKEFSLSILIFKLMANLILFSIVIPIALSFLKDNHDYDNFQFIKLIHEYYMQYVFTGLQEKSKNYMEQNIQYISMLFIFFQAILGIYLNIKLMSIFKQKKVANYLINRIENHEDKSFIVYVLLSIGLLMLLFNVDLEGCYKCSQEQRIDSSFLNLNSNNFFEIKLGFTFFQHGVFWLFFSILNTCAISFLLINLELKNEK